MDGNDDFRNLNQAATFFKATSERPPPLSLELFSSMQVKNKVSLSLSLLRILHVYRLPELFYIDHQSWMHANDSKPLSLSSCHACKLFKADYRRLFSVFKLIVRRLGSLLIIPRIFWRIFFRNNIYLLQQIEFSKLRFSV